jgi:hypothetical protein
MDTRTGGIKQRLRVTEPVHHVVGDVTGGRTVVAKQGGVKTRILDERNSASASSGVSACRGGIRRRLDDDTISAAAQATERNEPLNTWMRKYWSSGQMRQFMETFSSTWSGTPWGSRCFPYCVDNSLP